MKTNRSLTPTQAPRSAHTEAGRAEISSMAVQAAPLPPVCSSAGELLAGRIRPRVQTSRTAPKADFPARCLPLVPQRAAAPPSWAAFPSPTPPSAAPSRAVPAGAEEETHKIT